MTASETRLTRGHEPGSEPKLPGDDSSTVRRAATGAVVIRLWRAADLPTLIATAHVIHGTRGRTRLLMVVRCPFCNCRHQHGARLEFVEGKRNAACHKGRYVVRVGRVAGRVA